MITQGNMAAFGIVEQKRPEYWVSQLPGQRASENVAPQVTLGEEMVLQRARLEVTAIDNVAATVALEGVITLQGAKRHSRSEESAAATVTLSNAVTLQNVKQYFSRSEAAATTVSIDAIALDKGGIIRAHEFDRAAATIKVTNIYIQKV